MVSKRYLFVPFHEKWLIGNVNINFKQIILVLLVLQCCQYQCFLDAHSIGRVLWWGVIWLIRYTRKEISSISYYIRFPGIHLSVLKFFPQDYELGYNIKGIFNSIHISFVLTIYKTCGDQRSADSRIYKLAIRFIINEMQFLDRYSVFFYFSLYLELSHNFVKTTSIYKRIDQKVCFFHYNWFS